jgi:hypothetical protein
LLVFQLEAEVPGVEIGGALHIRALVADTVQSVNRPLVVSASLIGNSSGASIYRVHFDPPNRPAAR